MMLQCRLAWESYIEKYGYEQGSRLYSLHCDTYDEYIREQETMWKTLNKNQKSDVEKMYDMSLLGVLSSHSEPTPYMRYTIKLIKHKMGIGEHIDILDVDGARNRPILSVVSSYNMCVSRGMAQCPFHDDKTPSMKIYEATNSFYCFGCGSGGDVIDFVAKIENINFKEAVRLLTQ